jgi:MFS family permease
MGSTWSVIRGFNGSLRLWLLAWALASFAYFGLQAVLLNLYLLRLGFGPQFIGLLVGSGQVIWGLAALPAGALGRRVGLRTAQQAALVLLAVGFGAVLVVEALPRPLWEVWLFGWWAIGWIGAALLTVNLVPYLMAIADDLDQRNAVFPVQTAVSTLMTLVGSLIAGALPGLVVSWTGGSLGEPAPFRTALWPMPVLFVAAALVLGGAREARMADAAGRASRPRYRPSACFC